MLDRNQQLVEELVRAITRFLKERTGHGPEGYRTYLIDDMIVIRLLKTLTSVEYAMAATADGRKSVKDALGRLIRDLRPALEALVKTSTGAEVISVHSDLSTRNGERIIVFVLDRKVKELSGEPSTGA